MLNILLLILKIIGIILLIAVLLIIILAAVVLFVPIRYSGSGNYKDGGKPVLKLDAAWILKILRASASYEDGLHYKVSIFGKCILSSDGSDEAVKAAEAEPAENDARESAEAEPAEAPEITKAETEHTDAQDGAEVKSAGVSEVTETEPVDDSLTQAAASDGESAVGQEEVASDETPGTQMTRVTPSDEKAGTTKTDDVTPNVSGLSWYDAVLSRIKAAVDSIKAKVDAAVRFADDLCEKADRLAAFLNDESHKRAFKLLWDSLKHLLAHVGPKKLKGYAIFGFDDPSMTGYVLAALSQLPLPWGSDSGKKKKFEVIPVFDRKVTDIDADFRGRLRLIVPARIGLKIWFNKDFKKLYAEVTDGRK